MNNQTNNHKTAKTTTTKAATNGTAQATQTSDQAQPAQAYLPVEFIQSLDLSFEATIAQWVQDNAPPDILKLVDAHEAMRDYAESIEGKGLWPLEMAHRIALAALPEAMESYLRMGGELRTPGGTISRIEDGLG